MTVVPLTAIASPQTPPTVQRATASLQIYVRQVPDLGSPVVTWLRKGEAVMVVGESGEFAYVQTASGARGYLKRKYLVLPPAATAAPAPERMSAPAPVAVAPRPVPSAPASPEVAVTATPPVEDTPHVSPAPVTSRWYARASLGEHQPDTDARAIGDSLRSQGLPVFVERLDDEATTLGLTVGYQWLPFLSLEAGVLHLQDLDFRLTVDDPAHPQIPMLLQRLEREVPTSGTGLTASAVAHWDYSGWRLSARAGGFFGLDGDTDITVDGQRVALRTPDRNAVLLGAGLDYALTPHWRVGVDYQGLTRVDDFRLLGATLTYTP